MVWGRGIGRGSVGSARGRPQARRASESQRETVRVVCHEAERSRGEGRGHGGKRGREGERAREREREREGGRRERVEGEEEIWMRLLRVHVW